MKKLLFATSILLCLTIVLTGCTPKESPETKFLDNGEKLLEDYKYSQALEQYKKAINANPLNLESYQQAVKILQLKKRFSEAEELLKAAPEKANQEKILELLATNAYQAFDFVATGKYADQILAINKHNDLAITLKFKMLALLGTTESEAFTKTLDLSLLNQENQLLLGLAFVTDFPKLQEQLLVAKSLPGEKSALIQSLLDVLEQNPDELVRAAKISFLLIKSEYFEPASRYVDFLITKNHYYEAGFLYRAIVKTHFNEFAKANDDLAVAYSINPKLYEIVLLRTQVLYNLGKIDEANHYATEAVALAAADEQKFNNVLLQIVAAEQIDLATKMFQDFKTPLSLAGTKLLRFQVQVLLDKETDLADQAVALEKEISTWSDQQQAEFYAYYGLFALHHQDESNAILRLNKAQAKYPTLAETYLYLGMYYQNKEDYLAKQNLQTAIDLDFSGVITKKAQAVLAKN